MNDLFYKIYFWYKLIPCLHLSLLDNDVSPYHPLLLSTKTDLYFNIPFFFFFSVQNPFFLHFSTPLYCQCIESCSPINTWFINVGKVPPKLMKSDGLVLNSKAYLHNEYKLLSLQWDLQVTFILVTFSRL